jgi:hypothetical protein
MADKAEGIKPSGAGQRIKAEFASAVAKAMTDRSAAVEILADQPLLHRRELMLQALFFIPRSWAGFNTVFRFDG